MVRSAATFKPRFLNPLVLELARTISRRLPNLFLLLLSYAPPHNLVVAVIEVNRLVHILLLVQYFGFVELHEQPRVSKVGVLQHRVLEELEGVLILLLLHAIHRFDQFQFLCGGLRAHEGANAGADLALYGPGTQALL